MKLFSQATEARALQAITSVSKSINQRLSDGQQDAAGFLLASLDASHFHYDPCLAAYTRLMQIAKKRSETVSFADLLEDPTIDESYREILAAFPKKKKKINMEMATSVLNTLEKYRKVRSLYAAAKHIIESVKQPKVDVDKLMDEAAGYIADARVQSTVRDSIHIVGYEANADDLVDRVLSVDAENYLKTGFSEFDDKSGGLPTEGVLLLAATTSGGKSALRMNLMNNIFTLNQVSVATVSLEQNEVKETARMLSSMTSIEFYKFKRKTLSLAERDEVKEEWRKFSKWGKKRKLRYGLFCPTRSLTLTKTLAILKPYGFKVIAVDYVSLLEGVDEDNQARILKSITREAKVFSSENHCLVILLAQLDEDSSKIRYSRGMQEDADNCWIWDYSKPEQRDRHILPIVQKKARDQELYNFELKENFACMQVGDMDEYSSDSTESRTSSSDVDPNDPLATDDVDYAVN